MYFPVENTDTVLPVLLKKPLKLIAHLTKSVKWNVERQEEEALVWKWRRKDEEEIAGSLVSPSLENSWTTPIRPIHGDSPKDWASWAVKTLNSTVEFVYFSASANFKSFVVFAYANGLCVPMETIS